MKTVKKLAEQRAALITELESLEARLETLTPDEEARVNAIATELEGVNTELIAANKREEAKRTIAINTNPVKDTEEGVQKAYSFARAINLGTVGKLDGLEAEMHQEGVNEMRSFGQSASFGSVVIPSKILNQRATITENGTAGVKVQSFEEALQASSIIARVADLNLAVQDVRYIVPSAPTLAWETETGALNDVGATPAAVNLVPKRLGGYMDITMQMTRQHDVDVNAKYIQILGAAVGEALDYAALTTNSNVTAWAGSTLTASSNSDAGKLALTLIEKLYESKAVRGNPAFIASAGLYAELYSALQVTGVSPIVMNDRINGFPLYFSPFVDDVGANEMIFFANWQDYAVAQWGGVELLVDPYTQKGTGTNRLLLNCFFDMAQKRAASFKLGSFTGTDIS